MNTLKLQKKLEKKKNQTGLVGTRLEVNEAEGNSFSAGITFDFMNISLNYGKNLDLIPDKETQRFAEKRNIANKEEAEEKIGEDILEHETGHRENPTETTYGCPYKVEIHDRIKDSVTKALEQKGKKGLENDVTNAFEDILDNINCRRKTDFAGQTLFWNNQGIVNTENRKYSPFYEAFVKINLIIGGSIPDATLLRRFCTNDEKVQGSVKQFLDYLKSSINSQSILKLHEKSEFHAIFDLNLEKRTQFWEELAYQFALSTADLLDKPPTEKMFGFPENSFDRQMKLPKTKQKIAHQRYKEGKGPASYRDTYEQLYDLYKRISKEIPIKTFYYTDSSSMPLVHFGRRFVKEDERKPKFKGIGINQDGKLAIKTSRYSIDYPVSYKVHPINFPKLKIALMDRSGSMELSPNNDKNIGDTSFIPWGDNSKYHFAVKGYIGIDNFLEAQGISSYVENCALGFSGERSVRGNREEVAKSLLVKPSGGTSLDINGLEKELETGSFVLSISDGEFSLNDNLKQRLKDKISKVDYAHIQIGNDTTYSDFLRELGVPVFKVKGDDDLSNIMVNFVSDYYKSKQVQLNALEHPKRM